MKQSSTLVVLAFLAMACSLSAAIYDVGPGQPLATLSAVPWRTLQPGDFVNIHSQPGGYHEKIQISASGTAANHIVIRGIPDPTTAALPIIDGKDAIEDPSVDWRAAVFSKLGVIVVSPRKTGYVYGVYHVSYVDIETLDIRNATYTGNGSITYTDQFGVVRGYDTFACGIYIEWAHDLAVRGCEISNCGNGIFANSKNLAAQSSQRLLIEKNYFHDNSNPQTTDPNTGVQLSNGYGEHHIYVESAGSIIQYNRFGKLRPNAHGTAIKDRSAGQIIRYNDFDMDGESNVLALLDPQGGVGFIDQQPDYLDSYVYGNLVTIENYTSGIDAFWWGSYNGPGNLPNGSNSYATLHRRTLYFYNNTVVCHHNGVGLFFLPDTTYTGAANPTYENVDCRNNIFFADTTVQSSIYNALHFFTPGTTNSGGDITLTQNWISPNWRKDGPSHTWSGALNGTANLLVGDSGGANNPHFVDINAHDYHVLTGSNILDAGGPLASAALPANDVTREYLAPQTSQPRVLQGSSMDIGALESNGLATPPPVGGALQFSVGTFSRSESGGSATITVNRVGGNTGAVGVSYSTPAGGTASQGIDYTSVVGTLAWADGDITPKTFTVPILNDTEIEVAETVSLALYAPTGGAVLGSLASAALTILDDDTPPATLLYGLTATSNVLMLFKSDTPGTPLSYSNLSGLATGDILRAMAVQPVTGKLYAVGSASVLYTLDPFIGVATALGPAFAPALLSESMDLAFDRVSGLLRVVTAARQNLLLNPNTGAVVSTDGSIAFAAGDVNAGTNPILTGLDSFLNGGTQTFYGIDAAKDAFVRLSPATGQLTTVRAMGFDVSSVGGFDIPNEVPYGWAALSVGNAASCNLYVINVPAGNAILIGPIRTMEQMRDIAVAPPRDVWKQTRFGANAGIPAIAGDTADPDGNGVSNLIEYALGTPALNPSAAVAIPQTTLTNNALTLTFTRPATANDLAYTVQVSDDLVTWQDGSSYAPSGDVITNTFTTQISRSTSNGLETISVRDNTTSSAGKHFIRLKMVVP